MYLLQIVKWNFMLELSLFNAFNSIPLVTYDTNALYEIITPFGH